MSRLDGISRDNSLLFHIWLDTQLKKTANLYLGRRSLITRQAMTKFRGGLGIDQPRRVRRGMENDFRRRSRSGVASSACMTVASRCLGVKSRF